AIEKFRSDLNLRPRLTFRRDYDICAFSGSEHYGFERRRVLLQPAVSADLDEGCANSSQIEIKVAALGAIQNAPTLWSPGASGNPCFLLTVDENNVAFSAKRHGRGAAGVW